MLTKTVLILSLGVRVGPISTQTARGERANLEKYSPLAPGGPEYPQIQPQEGLFGPESQRTLFVAIFERGF